MKKPPKGIGLYIRTSKNGIQRYQSKLWNPILKRTDYTKTWEETDLNKVLVLHAQRKLEFAESNYSIQIREKQEPTPPQLLKDCVGEYLKYLRDDPKLVPKHKARKRSRQYVQNIEYYLSQFIKSLRLQGYKINHLHISAIGDKEASIFYDFLEARYHKKEIGERTWNQHIKACNYWFDTLINVFKCDIINPFDRIKPKLVFTDPQYLELDELYKFLECVVQENGRSTKGKKMETVNYYRPWLSTYFLISAFVGGRPNEMANLQWKHVGRKEIRIYNSKVNANYNTKAYINYVYIHPDLAKALFPMQLNAQSEEDYVLVPEWKNRKAVQLFASKAFTHFMKKSGIRKRLTIYNLRHTYINAMFNEIGERGIAVHHRTETAIRHYLSKQVNHRLQEGKRPFRRDFQRFIQID